MMAANESALIVFFISLFAVSAVAAEDKPVLKAGHPSLKEWILPAVPSPTENTPNAARVDLGRHLFFDPRLSGDGNMSCSTCHHPGLGWSDGLATAKGVKSSVLGRASPTIINSAFNTIMMWDGRKKDLEEQTMGPMESNVEMNMDTAKLFKWLNDSPGYRKLFEAAYPGEGINATTLSKGMAAFERTVVMNDSPFDRWLAGDEKAMTAQQVRGFDIFLDAGKGNCAACHSAPNFTDNGFHNIGLAAWGNPNPDMGRYAQKPVGRMKGAFKTPQLRGIALTAPYFHDGSAKTLKDVIGFYAKGGEVTTNIDPNIQPLKLSELDKDDLAAFLNALTGTTPSIIIPALPQ
jgi:cytochrome c peroxidase